MSLGAMLPHLHASIHPTTLDIAWVAGIFEGEGHCCATVSSGHRPSIKVNIVQKRRWILDHIRDRFGGRVTFRKNYSICSWDANGVFARGFLMTIYKFMSPYRKRQIWGALYPELVFEYESDNATSKK